MKSVLSACLYQTLRFDSKEEFEQYKGMLDKLNKAYRIDQEESQDACYIVRIRKMANTWPTGSYLDN